MFRERRRSVEAQAAKSEQKVAPLDLATSAGVLVGKRQVECFL